MNNPSNLPPGVTDKMIEDAQMSECLECGGDLETEAELDDGVCEYCQRKINKAADLDEYLDSPSHEPYSNLRRKA